MRLATFRASRDPRHAAMAPCVASVASMTLRPPGHPDDRCWSACVGAIGFMRVRWRARRPSRPQRSPGPDHHHPMQAAGRPPPSWTASCPSCRGSAFPPRAGSSRPLLIGSEWLLAPPAGGRSCSCWRGAPAGLSTVIKSFMRATASRRGHRPAGGRAGPGRHQLPQRARAQLRGHLRLAVGGGRASWCGPSGRGASSWAPWPHSSRWSVPAASTRVITGPRT